MINSPTLIPVNEVGVHKNTYVNPMHIATIRAVKNTDQYYVYFDDCHSILIDEVNVNKILTHCQLLIEKI